jgi:3-deoxy-7-phosphoheptulonate synthase
MSFTVVKKLPTIKEIIQTFSLSEEARARIIRDQQEVKNIISGDDSRMLIIVGPCSAWPYEATLTYAEKLKKLAEKHSTKLKIIMRVYTQKPRTSKGWTGPINQPDPFEPADIAEGLHYSRSLMTQIIEMGLPVADEAVFTHNAEGFNELLSWVAIGARSTEDQEHRVFASRIDTAVGMKNPTSGNLEIGVNSVVTAQASHTGVLHENQVQTHGNPYAHLVLRGGVARPNYHVEDLSSAKNYLEKAGVMNPAIIIDASHDNCKVNSVKDATQQIRVVEDVLTTLREHQGLKPLIKGFMLESFIEGGCQKIEKLTPETVNMNGLSITDPCLSWQQTEQILYTIADAVNVA